MHSKGEARNWAAKRFNLGTAFTQFVEFVVVLVIPTLQKAKNEGRLK